MSELRLIKVPFAKKDDAKSLDARWDASSKSWHVPHGVDPAKLMNWWRYLDCPYEEKDSARELGARWDKNTKKWFVPAEPGLLGLVARSGSNWLEGWGV